MFEAGSDFVGLRSRTTVSSARISLNLNDGSWAQDPGRQENYGRLTQSLYPPWQSEHSPCASIVTPVSA